MEGFLLVCIKSVVRQRILKDIRVIAVCNFAIKLYYNTELKTFPPLCYAVLENTPVCGIMLPNYPQQRTQTPCGDLSPLIRF
jgi:hypothetical protein